MTPDHSNGQGDLFALPPKPPPAKTEQQRELERVSGRIAESVIDFLRNRLLTRREFRAAELASFVTARCGGAPASADRVFRALRSSGQVEATLLSRSGSLYRVDAVRRP